MARANYQEQNLGKLQNPSVTPVTPSLENPLHVQLKCLPCLVPTLVRPRQVQPEYTSKVQNANLISWIMCSDLIVDFSLPFGSGK